VKKDDEGLPIMIGRTLTNRPESASMLMTLLQDDPAERFPSCASPRSIV
jgi:hypothetical protein